MRLMIYILHYLNDPNYGNNGIFLIMGNAGFISSTVVLDLCRLDPFKRNPQGLVNAFSLSWKAP